MIETATWEDMQRLQRQLEGAQAELRDLRTRPAGPREKLTAARTYYVRTDGNDSNNGLSNTASGAFLTPQRALDVVSDKLDFGSYQVTIQIADGTYTGLTMVRPVVAASIGNTPPLIIRGNQTTPSNVVLQTTTADSAVFSVRSVSHWVGLQYVRIQANVSGGVGVVSEYGSRLSLKGVDFGVCQNIHLYVLGGGLIYLSDAYTISGAANYHYYADSNGIIYFLNNTCTLSGTLAFTIFAVSSRGTIRADGSTFTGGTITGTRYTAQILGAIYGDGNANKFPGSVAGTPVPGVLGANGGYYV